jgi:hypothetical protein
VQQYATAGAMVVVFHGFQNHSDAITYLGQLTAHLGYTASPTSRQCSTSSSVQHLTCGR